MSDPTSESYSLDGTDTRSKRLPILLAMAMFVLVVDTSLMNVSISSVVEDLDATVSGVQSAIALEALVSAAFILIGSKIGDLFGRKRAYVLGLLGYAAGALAMAFAQNLLTILICWAILGGLGASLLLPAMQSLIHGNFEGDAQKRVYALVGAAAAIAAAVGPLIGGFITTYLSWRVAFLGEAIVIAIVLSGIGLVRDVAYTGDRGVDVIGAILSIVGMGGIVLGILVWEDGGEAVGLLMGGGAIALATLAWWLVRRKRAGKPALIDPTLFSSKHFRLGITSQMMQQIALGGTMIALPIFLQMVLEYNAMQAGLSLAPLSLSMFAVALIAGKKAVQFPLGQRHPRRLRAAPGRAAGPAPDRATGRLGLVSRDSARDRRLRARAARVATEQLHALADLRGTGERGGRRQLRRRLVRTVVRTGVRRCDHARLAVDDLHGHGRGQRRVAGSRTATGRRRARGRRRADEQHSARGAAGRATSRRSRPRSSGSTPTPVHAPCRSRCVIPILAALIGLVDALRMRRLPDLKPSGSLEGMLFE